MRLKICLYYAQYNMWKEMLKSSSYKIYNLNQQDSQKSGEQE